MQKMVTVSEQATKAPFEWNGMAGVSINLFKRLGLFVEARYSGIQDVLDMDLSGMTIIGGFSYLLIPTGRIFFSPFQAPKGWGFQPYDANCSTMWMKIQSPNPLPDDQTQYDRWISLLGSNGKEFVPPVFNDPDGKPLTKDDQIKELLNNKICYYMGKTDGKGGFAAGTIKSKCFEKKDLQIVRDNKGVLQEIKAKIPFSEFDINTEYHIHVAFLGCPCHNPDPPLEETGKK
jgi:hypothetical protein